MCNAWNHPSDCDCGWGGNGNFGNYGSYGGYGTGGGCSSFRSTINGEIFEFPFLTYPSYVNPNARCPVCGASVYFYQSPYGGRVFFDELGPPWPKHPCTDNPIVRHHFSSAERRALFRIDTRSQLSESDSERGERNPSSPVETFAVLPVEPRIAAWAEVGWMPFVVTRIVPRRIGIEAEGKLLMPDGSSALFFRIIQASADARFHRTQGELRIGFSLVQNTNLILSALNESPILLKRDPGMRNLTLSSFILTPEGNVEEITLSVVGVEEEEQTS
jgi:hypothetical protein